MSKHQPRRTDAGRRPNTDSRYEVGYGRPPVHSRFKPGISGNPPGRPTKLRNISREIQDLYTRGLPFRDGSQVQSPSGIVALVQQILRDAIKGDKNSMVLCYKIATDFGVFKFKDEVRGDFSKLSAEENARALEAAFILNKAGFFDRGR